MHNKFSRNSKAQSGSGSEMDKLGEGSTHTQKTQEPKETNKIVTQDFSDEWIFPSHTRRELKDIQKKTDNSKIIYNNGLRAEKLLAYLIY